MSSNDPLVVLDWSVALGAATVVLAVGFSLPQLVRLTRTGSTAGVSLPAVTNSTISFAAWTVYAWTLADPWLLASSAVGLPGTFALAVLSWRRGADTSGLWLPFVWVAVLAAATVVDVTLGSGLAATFVGASVLWLLVPALVTAWRSDDVSGLAAGTWWVLGLEGALFLGYGAVASVPASLVYGVVTLIGCTGILGRIALMGRAAAEPSGDTPRSADELVGVSSGHAAN